MGLAWWGCVPLLLALVHPVDAGSIDRALDELRARSELKGASVGISVVELPSGRELYRSHADRSLIPASNMKLVTLAAALELLGPQFRYQTIVALSGPDLVVIGSGDPAIGTPYAVDDPTVHFRQWADRLRQRGVTRIAGELVVDDRLFDRQFRHPHWPRDQWFRPYAAPVGAAALNGNSVNVHVRPSRRAGSPAHVELRPMGSNLRLDADVQTVSQRSTHLWSVYRAPESAVIQVRGRFYEKAGEATAAVSVEHPTRFFGSVLETVLNEEGISLSGRLHIDGPTRYAHWAPQVVHETSLVPLLPLLGKESDNFTAEQIFKTIGAMAGRKAEDGERRANSESRIAGHQPPALGPWSLVLDPQPSNPGSWSSGQRAVLEFLRQSQLPMGWVRIDDGSGLSAENRLTAEFVTALLRRMSVGEHSEMFRESLSVAGVDGTLERRLRHPTLQGRVWAKSGTLRGVRALSGYIHTRRGRWLAFSLIVNDCHRSLRQIEEDFCRLLVED